VKFEYYVYYRIIACHQWNGIVNSRYLFTAILTSIKEVVKENNITPEKIKNMGKAQKAFKRNPNNKFSKRFNMGGSGLSSKINSS